jgi:hypothetical protein
VQVCGIRTLLPGAVLVWLIRPTLAPRAGNAADFPFRGVHAGVEFRSGRLGRGGGELAPERPAVVVHIPVTADLRRFEAPGPEGPVLVHVPAGHHSGADHEIAEPGQTVGGVCFEGELEELVGFAASAFPPVDEGDGGEDGR